MNIIGEFDENIKLKTIFSRYYNLIYSKITHSSYRYGVSKNNDALFGLFGPEILYINCINENKVNNLSLERFINIFHKIIYGEYTINTKARKNKIYYWNDNIRIKHDNVYKNSKVYLEYFQNQTLNNLNFIKCNKKSALYKIILLVDILDMNIFNIIDYITIYQIDVDVVLLNNSYILSDIDMLRLNNRQLNTSIYIPYNDDNIFKTNLKTNEKYIKIWCNVRSNNFIDILYNIKKHQNKFWYFFIPQVTKNVVKNMLFTDYKKINKSDMNNIIDYCFKNNVNFNVDQLSSDLLIQYFMNIKNIDEQSKKSFLQFVQLNESGKFNCVIDYDGFIYKSLYDMDLSNKTTNIFNFNDFINNVWIKYFLNNIV